MADGNTIVSADDLPGANQTDLDAEGQQLRAQALESDQSPGVEESQTEESAQEGSQRAAATETEAKPTTPEVSADRPRDPVTGKFLKKGEFPTQESAAKQETEQPETDYAKAKAAKEQERQRSVLANFEQEKQRARAEIEAQRQQLAQERALLQQQAAQGQQPRFSSQHLWQAAKEFEANAKRLLQEGKNELDQSKLDQSDKQYALAEQTRQAAQESWFYEQQEAYQAQLQQHEQAWKANCAQVIQQNPDLGNPESPVAQEMVRLLEQEPLLGQIPDGFKKAWELLQMRQAATEASGLREENAKLKQQLDELQKRTALKGSGPTPHSEKNLEDLPLDEQAEILRRGVMEQDRSAWAV
jgi:hypothetical protein